MQRYAARPDSPPGLSPQTDNSHGFSSGHPDHAVSSRSRQAYFHPERHFQTAFSGCHTPPVLLQAPSDCHDVVALLLNHPQCREVPAAFLRREPRFQTGVQARPGVAAPPEASVPSTWLKPLQAHCTVVHSC